MNKIISLFLMLLVASFLYSNEKDTNFIERDSSNLFVFQDDVEESNIIIKDPLYVSKSCFTFGVQSFEKYAAQKKVTPYLKHLYIGIGLLVPGVILTVLSIPLIAAGVVLTTWSETRTEVVYDSWVYAKESVGGSTMVTKPVEYTVYPYQAVGIPLASTGGLFFVVGVPLLIVGAVNLAKAAKYKMKRTELNNNFAFSLNYNLNDESINFLLKYTF